MFNAIKRALGNILLSVGYRIEDFGWWLRGDKVSVVVKTPTEPVELEPLLVER